MVQENESNEEEREVKVGFIGGRIVDKSNKPLEGVRVTTNDSATYSDEKGDYLIGDRICLNPHQLMAYLEGFELHTEKVNLAAKDPKVVTVVMAKLTSSVSGVVKEAGTLDPLGGVEVCLGSPTSPCVTSGADGSYRLTDDAGTYGLSGKKDGYRDYLGDATVPGTKSFRMRKKSS